MAGQLSDSFAGLLRRLRIQAGLTQEQLAEAATISVRAVSDLERGVNQSARRETARLLAEALGLAGEARTEFMSAARAAPAVPLSSPPTADQVVVEAGATRTLPRDIGSFIGRETELQMLLDVLATSAAAANAAVICAVGGMAGIGKTAFAVHAAHLLRPRFPDGQIFLPLHGHTAGQRPVDPAEALGSLLLTAGVADWQIPPDLEARSRLWRDYLARRRMLLVLDDATGHEQVRPLLPGSPGTLVLITSRTHLTALEDAHPLSLDVLTAAEATELLIRVADRPDLNPEDESIADITTLCGQLPLAIAMLARQLCHHPTWSSARLALGMAAARDRLEFMQAENLSVAAAFDLSYRDLTEDQQRLFRRLAIHPGDSIDAYAAAALHDCILDVARRGLDTLYSQHLLTEPAQDRYRFHALIRDHARNLTAANESHERDAALRRLLDYYLSTAQAASGYLDRRSPGPAPTVRVRRPAHSPRFFEHAGAITWFDAERLNLHIVTCCAARDGQTDYVIGIAAAMHNFLRRYGHWDQALTVHQLALDAARQTGDDLAQAIALVNLGDIQGRTGDYPSAAANLTEGLRAYRRSGSQLGQASALNELGAVQEATGNYPAAAASHLRALSYYRAVADLNGEAGALDRLGVVDHATGDFAAAATNHQEALRLYRHTGYEQGEADALNHLGTVQQRLGNHVAATASHQEALRIYSALGSRIGQGSALTRLGYVHHAVGDYAAATASHQQACQIYDHVGYRLGQARALTGLACAQRATGHRAAAAASLMRAHELYDDLGIQDMGYTQLY